jgi:hypothetical protein
VELTSRKAEGVEQYKIEHARDADAFPEPKWPTQSLDTLIVAAFSPDRTIDREDFGLSKEERSGVEFVGVVMLGREGRVRSVGEPRRPPKRRLGSLLTPANAALQCDPLRCLYMGAGKGTALLRIAAIGVAFASIGTAEQADASQTLMYSCVPQETRTGARERLISVDVSVSDLRPEGRWSVVYHAANGAAYDRTKQYDLVGNIGPGRYWTGRLKTNPNRHCAGYSATVRATTAHGPAQGLDPDRR